MRAGGGARGAGGWGGVGWGRAAARRGVRLEQKGAVGQGRAGHAPLVAVCGSVLGADGPQRPHAQYRTAAASAVPPCAVRACSLCCPT